MNPIEDLKERLEKIKLFGAGSGEDWVTFCDDAYALAEAYREMAVEFFVHEDTPEPIDYESVDFEVEQILKTSREG